MMAASPTSRSRWFTLNGCSKTGVSAPLTVAFTSMSGSDATQGTVTVSVVAVAPVTGGGRTPDGDGVVRHRGAETSAREGRRAAGHEGRLVDGGDRDRNRQHDAVVEGRPRGVAGSHRGGDVVVGLRPRRAGRGAQQEVRRGRVRQVGGVRLLREPAWRPTAPCEHRPGRTWPRPGPPPRPGRHRAAPEHGCGVHRVCHEWRHEEHRRSGGEGKAETSVHEHCQGLSREAGQRARARTVGRAKSARVGFDCSDPPCLDRHCREPRRRVRGPP